MSVLAGAVERRRAVLRALGATAGVVEQLLAYNSNRFDAGALTRPLPLPLPDEPCVAAWEAYASEAATIGVLAALRPRFAQLSFPVESGVSRTPAYTRATQQGLYDGRGAALALRRPERLRLFIHGSAAGRIPVLLAPDREDFVTLVRAFAHRNEPVPVPDSMAACTVGGLNNWERLRACQREWIAGQIGRSEAVWWREVWPGFSPRKELYQDRLVIVAEGPYSAVPAAAVGESDERWASLSLTIRIEHECAHYFTRRVLGSMSKYATDELMADYAGIVAACRHFRADWLLRFLGLEAPEAYREGGRLENYRGHPPLSDAAFRLLQTLVRRAAVVLETFDRSAAADAPAARVPRSLLALSTLTLEELAGDDGPDRLAAAWTAAGTAV